MLSLFLFGCNNLLPTEPIPKTTLTSKSLATSTPSTNIETDTKNVLVLADISQDPIEKISLFQPFADYLATRLHSFKIEKGVIKIAPDLETMAEWLKTGQADLYIDSLYPAMLVNQYSNAQPILRHSKNGMAEYHTLIFTHIDSGITSLEQLKGQRIAFEVPFSTSGYMLPLAYLLEQGFEVEEKKKLDTPVTKDQIGYVFSQRDQNTVNWVISNQVAAGVIDNLTYFNEVPEEIRAQFTILAETNSVPRQAVMIRSDLEPKMVDSIRSILLEMHQDEEGQVVLESFEKTLKFDEFPEGGKVALNKMRKLYEFTQRQ